MKTTKILVPLIAGDLQSDPPVFSYTVVEGEPRGTFETDTPPISLGEARNYHIMLDNEKALFLVGYADTEAHALAVIGMDITRHADVMIDMF